MLFHINKLVFFLFTFVFLITCNTSIKSDQIDSSTDFLAERARTQLKYFLEKNIVNDKKWISSSPEETLFNTGVVHSDNRTDIVGEKFPILQVVLKRQRKCPSHKYTQNGFATVKVKICNYGTLPTEGLINLFYTDVLTSFNQIHIASPDQGSNWTVVDPEMTSFTLDEVLSPGMCSSTWLTFNFLYMCEQETCLKSLFYANNTNTDSISSIQEFSIVCKRTKRAPLLLSAEFIDQNLCPINGDFGQMNLNLSICEVDKDYYLSGNFSFVVLGELLNNITIETISYTPNDYYYCTNGNFLECSNQQEQMISLNQCLKTLNFNLSYSNQTDYYGANFLVTSVFISYESQHPLMISPPLYMDFACSPSQLVDTPPISFPATKAPIFIQTKKKYINSNKRSFEKK